MAAPLISEVGTAAIDLGTFAIIISILVGIVTIWSAIRAAKQQADKASKTLEEIRNKSNSDIWTKINDVRERLQVLEIRYADRLTSIERSLNRLEQFSWGRDSKSVPSYMRGGNETEEQKGRKERGMFKDLEDKE